MIAFFLLLSLTASAQQWRQQPYFMQYKGVKADSGLTIPKDTAAQSSLYGDKDGNIAYQFGKFWGHCGAQRWRYILDELSGPYVNVRWYGAKGDGVTDDSLAIKRAIDTAHKYGLRVYFPGNATYGIGGTIILKTGTHLELAPTARILLLNGASNHMLRNENLATNVSRDIVDSNIVVSGGIWDGNMYNQDRYSVSDGAINVGFMFSGVKNLSVRGVTLVNVKTYAVRIVNFNNVTFKDIVIDHGAAQSLTNQDGLHFGVGNNVYIENIRARTWDDAISICANDRDTIGQGPYQLDGDVYNITIRGVTLDTALNGIRLLSGDNKLHNVNIDGVNGVVRDNLFQITSFNLGVGDFDGISISNVNVGTTDNVLFTPEFFGYIIISDSIRNLSINNVVRRVTDNIARSTIRILPSAKIGNMVINNVTTEGITSATARDIEIFGGAHNITISEYSYKGRSAALGAGFYTEGAEIGHINISNSDWGKLFSTIEFKSSSIGILNVSNVSADTCNVPITVYDNSTLDTLIMSNSRIKDQTGRNIYVTSSGSIGRVITPPTISFDPANPSAPNGTGYVIEYNGVTSTILPIP